MHAQTLTVGDEIEYEYYEEILAPGGGGGMGGIGGGGMAPTFKAIAAPGPAQAMSSNGQFIVFVMQDADEDNVGATLPHLVAVAEHLRLPNSADPTLDVFFEAADNLTAEYPRHLVAVDGPGTKYAVAWRNNNDGIDIAMYAPGGIPLGSKTINAGMGESLILESLEMRADGRFAIAWTANSQFGGAAIGSQVKVFELTAPNLITELNSYSLTEYDPVLAWSNHGNGEFHLLTTSLGGFWNQGAKKLRRFNASGALQQTVTIQSNFGMNYGQFALTNDPAGNVAFASQRGPIGGLGLANVDVHIFDNALTKVRFVPDYPYNSDFGNLAAISMDYDPTTTEIDNLVVATEKIYMIDPDGHYARYNWDLGWQQSGIVPQFDNPEDWGEDNMVVDLTASGDYWSVGHAINRKYVGEESHFIGWVMRGWLLSN